VITHDAVNIHRLNRKSVISAGVQAFLKEVKAKHPADAEARRLHHELLEMLPELKGRSNLIVVRDGPLHLVPFDALKSASGRFLVESKVITYAPSATSFYLLRCGNHSNDIARNVLAVGGVPYGRSGLKSTFVTRGGQPEGADLPDLPSSEDEARVATSTLPSPSNRLLLGQSATETAFKRSVDHGIIHLAVHGIANEMRPEHAALVLLSDPAKGEDGFLQPSEIVQLPLRADLVVLSACDTAVGALEGQEGVANLSSAFLLAGARTVVSTLWSLDDDSTLYLMKIFYNEIGAGKDAAVALAHAKRTMLSKLGDGNALPYYWAAFTAEGFVPRRAQP
jgi:CHAT domain-containing protein